MPGGSPDLRSCSAPALGLLGDHFSGLRASKSSVMEWENRPRTGSCTDLDSGRWSIIYSLWDLELVGEALIFSSVQGEIRTIMTATTYMPGRVLVFRSGSRHESPMWG